MSPVTGTTPKPDQISVTSEKIDSVAVVRFSNPPNALITTKGAVLLEQAFSSLLTDDAVRAIVLTGGVEGHFIRHADVGQIGRAAEALTSGASEPKAFASSTFARLFRLIAQAHKPVIAAIDGACMGGGLEIALACTMRIASPQVQDIGLPEIRLGMIPGAGGPHLLARVIGWHKAKLLILEGAVVSGRQALDLGLIDVLAEQPLTAALQAAERFAARPPGVVAAVLAFAISERALSDAQASTVRFAELLRDDEAAATRLRSFHDRGLRLQDLK